LAPALHLSLIFAGNDRNLTLEVNPEKSSTEVGLSLACKYKIWKEFTDSGKD